MLPFEIRVGIDHGYCYYRGDSTLAGVFGRDEDWTMLAVSRRPRRDVDRLEMFSTVTDVE